MGKVRIFSFSILVIIISAVFILYPSEFAGSFIFRTEGMILFAGYFCLVGGIYLLVQYLYLFIFVGVGLKITNEGIINNTTLLYSEAIKWSHIDDISVCKKQKKCIDIFVQNPKCYIKKTKNPLRRMNLYMYYYFNNTIFSIGVHFLDIETKELVKLLKGKWRENR